MKLVFGLAAGAIAAIVAALVSLPLVSPDDVVFNSWTVTVGALAAGVYLGVLWMFLSRMPNGMMMYAGAALVAFGVAVLLAFVSQTQLERSISYIVPLAAIVFAIATPLVPLLSMAALPRNAQLGGAAVSLVAALAIGVGLSGMGDAESGHLSLPGVRNNSTPTPGATATLAPGGTTSTPGVATATAARPTAAPSDGTITPADVAGVVYTVVAGESQLTYSVREKFASFLADSDAVGRTGTLSGTVRLDGQSQVQVNMSTLRSDLAQRDEYVSGTTFASDPIVTFVLDGVDLPASYTPGETFNSTVTGTVTIRGFSAPITFDVEALLSGNELQVHGTTQFTWADYHIPKPSVPGDPGLITVRDNITIEVLIIARS